MPKTKKETKTKKKNERNLNVQAAYLHVLGDMLNSIGVIISAGIIMIWPSAWYFDPICTYFFSIITIVTTFKTFSSCVSTFLEVTPENMDPEVIKLALEKINGVEEAHDLHLWSISQNKNAFTVHLKLETTMCDLKQCKHQEVLEKADRLMRVLFDVHHLCI